MPDLTQPPLRGQSAQSVPLRLASGPGGESPLSTTHSVVVIATEAMFIADLVLQFTFAKYDHQGNVNRSRRAAV